MKCPYGFRIVGDCGERRRLVDDAVAFAAHCRCDDLAQVERESYLSAFSFGPEFRRYLEKTGSVAGYRGECWSPWLWFDLDRDDLETARRDAARLALFLVERYLLDDDGLLVFFSGGKGFHVGLPTSLWMPEPSASFHRHCRQIAETLADQCKVTIDQGVYDTVRPFRAPNSRHPKTGLHKRRVTLEELINLTADRLAELARLPLAFDLPKMPPICDQGQSDWQAAVEAVTRRDDALIERRASGTTGATLNRATLDFIRDGADQGDRHRLLFSAAANLGEFGCPVELALVLLTEAALDSGLSPKETRRQIECGLTHARGGDA